MLFEQLDPGESINISDNEFVIQADIIPGVRDQPYFELGSRAGVLQLKEKKGDALYALKVFINPSKRILSFSNHIRKNGLLGIEGMEVASRYVLTPTKEKSLLNKYPNWNYSVLMPWISGETWLEILLKNHQKGNNFLFDKDSSLYFAHKLSSVLNQLEISGYSHCDVCSNNIILNIDTGKVSLVDIEDMWGPGLTRDKNFKGQQFGYSHPNSTKDERWSKYSDRFSAGILLSEIICWFDEDFRKQAQAESFFSNSELQIDSNKSAHMEDLLLLQLGPEIVEVFRKMWKSKRLETTPEVQRWHTIISKAISKRNLSFGKIKCKVNGNYQKRDQIVITRKKVDIAGDKSRSSSEAVLGKKVINITSSKKKSSVSPSIKSQQKIPPVKPSLDFGTILFIVVIIVGVMALCITIALAN